MPSAGSTSASVMVGYKELVGAKAGRTVSKDAPARKRGDSISSLAWALEPALPMSISLALDSSDDSFALDALRGASPALRPAGDATGVAAGMAME